MMPPERICADEVSDEDEGQVEAVLSPSNTSYELVQRHAKVPSIFDFSLVLFWARNLQ